VKAVFLSLASHCGERLATCVAQIPLPKFEDLVTDLTGTLTAQQAALDEKLTLFRRARCANRGSHVAKYQPEDIAQFGIRLADAWKVGRGAG
jgi:uncharacterized protein